MSRRFWWELLRDTARDHGWATLIACGLLLPVVLAASLIAPVGRGR